MDQHWRPQFYQLFGELINFDFIGKVENFDEDLLTVDKYLEGKLLNHHENVLWHQTGSDKKIADYYNNEIAKKVANIYSTDFEIFGYSSNWREAKKD